MRLGEANASHPMPPPRPHGDGLLVAGLFFTDYPPPSWEKIPPVEDPGLCDPPGEPGSAFPPVFRDWEIKGLGMSSLVYATGHIKDPVPLIAKRRGLSPGGRFPPSFIHLVIIIAGLNKLQLYVLALKMALDADRA